jgi:hypothetical protein
MSCRHDAVQFERQAPIFRRKMRRHVQDGELENGGNRFSRNVCRPLIARLETKGMLHTE